MLGYFTVKPDKTLLLFYRVCVGSDFNECTVYGTCSQTCTNTDGSYTCSCVEGYLVQPDNRSCKAKNGKTNITVQDKIKKGFSVRVPLTYMYPNRDDWLNCYYI